MTPDLIVDRFVSQTGTDRMSPELRAYVRSEWRGDAWWLHRASARITLRARFRRWLASRRPTSPAALPSVEAPSSVRPVGTLAPVETIEPCLHADVEGLGLDGGVEFLRCLLCGGVLVVDQGREWSLRSVPIQV